MNDFFVMYARDARRANQTVLGLVGGLPLAVRNQPGRTYYGSLHRLTAHILDANIYFLNLFKPALTVQAGIFDPLAECTVPDGEDDEQWYERLRAAFVTVDDVVVALAEKLTVQDWHRPVALTWYPDRPTVPAHFLYNQLIVHGLHHRGQIAQVLDALGIENDFSGIEVQFMSL